MESNRGLEATAVPKRLYEQPADQPADEILAILKPPVLVDMATPALARTPRGPNQPARRTRHRGSTVSATTPNDESPCFNRTIHGVKKISIEGGIARERLMFLPLIVLALLGAIGLSGSSVFPLAQIDSGNTPAYVVSQNTTDLGSSQESSADVPSAAGDEGSASAGLVTGGRFTKPGGMFLTH